MNETATGQLQDALLLTLQDKHKGWTVKRGTHGFVASTRRDGAKVYATGRTLDDLEKDIRRRS